MSTDVIGFAGRKRSGKDTAGAALQQLGFHRLSFAAPLKLMLRALLAYQGATDEQIEAHLEGDLKEAPSAFLGGQSARHALQTLGTEWGRQLIEPDLWVDALANAAALHDKVVVTDVRFPNEVAVIQALGGRVYRISRPGLGAPADAHASEALIDALPVDGEFLNDAPNAEAFARRVALMFAGPAPDLT